MVYIFLFFFSLENFILPKLVRLMFYWLTDLILSRFLGSILFMLISGLHKMLNILIEIIVKSFS